MKFVHAADLHIDSPLRGLGAYDGAPVDRVRGATRRALANLVQLCLDERAALLILAGDVFDGEWKDFNTGLFFVKQLNRLRDAGTRVFLVRGNHDAMSEVTRALELPDHVHEFADGRAETIVDDRFGVALHGLSFARREMRDSPVPLYPAPVADALNIGVLHTSAGGHAQHATYAPCAVDELVRKGYDYWALGHVHAHDILHRAPSWVVFPGNTQGRHIRESGPKGCVVVTVEDGAISEVRPAALDVVRWQRVELRLGEEDGVDELYESARRALERARREADGRLVAARLVVGGATRAHAAISGDRQRIAAQLRAFCLDGLDELWLEKIELRTRPAVAIDELRASEGFVGELLRAVAAAKDDPALAAELRAQLQPLVDKLGDELGGELDLAALIDEAEARLVAELVTP
ncbi:MAG TPA: DNA repair exonuclease [Polyangia bacterium]|jgi:DNA repair exonuclease SbcCD nuclease subunit|nr:DNA repair exonuclease [Polyangia bacterium]